MSDEPKPDEPDGYAQAAIDSLHLHGRWRRLFPAAARYAPPDDAAELIARQRGLDRVKLLALVRGMTAERAEHVKRAIEKRREERAAKRAQKGARP